MAPQNLAQAEKSLRDELARAYRDGITEEELAEAKRGIIQSRAVNRAQDGLIASNWVNNLELGKTWQFSKATEEAVMKLTVEDGSAPLLRSREADLRARGRPEEGSGRREGFFQAVSWIPGGTF